MMHPRRILDSIYEFKLIVTWIFELRKYNGVTLHWDTAPSWKFINVILWQWMNVDENELEGGLQIQIGKCRLFIDPESIAIEEIFELRDALKEVVAENPQLHLFSCNQKIRKLAYLELEKLKK